MATWGKTTVPISERISKAAAELKAALPAVIGKQADAVAAMAKVVQLAEKGIPK